MQLWNDIFYRLTAAQKLNKDIMISLCSQAIIVRT